MLSQEHIRVPGCSGVTVREMPSAHGLHILEVNVAPGGEIPLHTHDCAATMIITRGSACKLISGGSGDYVGPGDVVRKAKGEPHGFSAIGEDGFQFISFSDGDGILREHSDDDWDLRYV